jgi:hypothetical protein
MKKNFTKKLKQKFPSENVIFFFSELRIPSPPKRTSRSLKNEFVFFSLFLKVSLAFKYPIWIHTQIQIHNAGLDLLKIPLRNNEDYSMV